MIRFIPFKVDFDFVKKIGKFQEWLQYVAALVGVILIILHQLKHGVNAIENNLNVLLGILAIFYFVGDLLQKYLQQKAEQKRRRDFIDNGLNTNLAAENSQGYYTNDHMEFGVMKMGVNSFENCFYSKFISGKMIPFMVIKCLVLLLIFLLVAFTQDQVSLLTLIQMALPFTIVQQTIIIVIYHAQMDIIFQQYQLIFSSAQENKKELLIIHNVINYESTIAWAGVLLSSPIFDKHNVSLESQWVNIKSTYNLS